jgi:hypothetical protein
MTFTSGEPNLAKRSPGDRLAPDAPLTPAGEAFLAALWRATDASLRQDPSRWPTRSAGERSVGYAEDHQSGARAYLRDARRDAREAARDAAGRWGG